MSVNQQDHRRNLVVGDEGSSAVPCNSSRHSAVPSLDDADINPFVHRLHLSTSDKIQAILMTITLVPVKGILAFTSLVIAWFLAFICLYGRTEEDAKKPLTGWRNWLRPVVVFFARGLFFFGGFHWVTVKGQRASAKEAPILAMAPHSSFFDALPVTYLGLTSVVAKTSAIKVPFFGTLTKFTQPVLVDREDPHSRQNTIKEMRRRAATGGEWPQMIIFPEGTCTNRTCLISYKPGAFIPGVPVQPVCVKYPCDNDTITWTWCGLGALKALYLTLCQLNTRFEIEFLPVYTPSEAEKNDALLFARNVRVEMAKALGVPITEHSYEDGEVLCHVADLGFPPASHLVNLHHLFRRLGSRVDHTFIERLRGVLQIDSLTQLDESKFVNSLQNLLPVDTCQQLFHMYGKTDNVVDIRRLFVDVYLVSRPASAHDVLQFAFHVYDSGHKEHLNKSEANELLRVICRQCVDVDDGEHNPLYSYERVKRLAAVMLPTLGTTDDNCGDNLSNHSVPISAENSPRMRHTKKAN